jgi:hypothetical protein
VGEQDLGLVAVFYGLMDMVGIFVLIGAYLWARTLVPLEEELVDLVVLDFLINPLHNHFHNLMP